MQVLFSVSKAGGLSNKMCFPRYSHQLNPLLQALYRSTEFQSRLLQETREALKSCQSYHLLTCPPYGPHGEVT